MERFSDPAAHERLRDAGGVEVLCWPELDDHGVDAVVTTRSGGVSTGPYSSLNLALHVGDTPDAVVENRRRGAAALGAGLGDLVLGVQVHGAEAVVVTSADRGRGATGVVDAIGGVDALVTAVEGPVLTTLVADCAPILLVDPVARVIATVHAGWRGTVARVVDAAVARARSLGAEPGRMLAFIGPTVSAASYEVGDEVASAVRGCLGDGGDLVLGPARPGHWLLDVAAANRLLLIHAGLSEDSIRTSGLSTADPRLFSDRRQRPCGRFGLLARLRP